MSFNSDFERHMEGQECEYDRKLDSEFPAEELVNAIDPDADEPPEVDPETIETDIQAAIDELPEAE
jgi:hypothetical protein